MARLKEIISDTLGITAAKQSAADIDAGKIFYEYRSAGKVSSGLVDGAMQVMAPNVYYDMISKAHVSGSTLASHTLKDVGVIAGMAALVVVGQPEIAVAVKVVYNAVSSRINRDRALRQTASHA